MAGKAGRSGRRLKPHGLKVLEGTADGEAPEVSFPVAGDLSPPPWLENAHALKEWHTLIEILSASRVLSDADMTMLGHLCRLHGKIVQGYIGETSPTAAELTQLRTFYTEFGLTPSSRTRVKAAGSVKESNPFAGLKTG